METSVEILVSVAEQMARSNGSIQGSGCEFGGNKEITNRYKYMLKGP
jgi:hypothetical protein